LTIPLLLDSGHEVIGLTRTPGALAGTGAEEIVADLTDRAAFLRLTSGLKADAVIHHATALRRPPRRPRDMVATNRLRTEGTSTLIAAARAMGAKRFVGASVVYGYGFRDTGPDPLDESAPFGEEDHPSTAAVQRALLSLEQQVTAFGGVILRFGLFYAPDDPVPPVATDADGVLPFIHIADAAAATVASLKRVRGVFNVVDDDPVSWRELHTERAHALGLREPQRLPSWMFDLGAPFATNIATRTSMRVSNAYVRKSLRWRPSFPSFRDALERHVGGAP
jgi:nucleoside-diphosphate-sugar epimerase